MNAITYSRVSTKNQGLYGISLEEQYNRTNTYALLNNFNVIDNIKEVCSAHNNYTILRYIDKFNHDKNLNIIISDVSRFSRNLYEGLNKARELIIRGHTLHFLRENLIIKDVDDFSYHSKLSEYLKEAEKESLRISERIRQVKEYQKNNGIFMGGRLSFGLDVYTDLHDNKKKYKFHEKEIKIVKFIDICRKNHYTTHELNNSLCNILGYVPNDLIVLFETGSEDKIRYENFEPMDNSSIALLLNDYDIKYRNNKPFTFSIIGNINSEKYLSQYVNENCEINNVISDFNKMDLFQKGNSELPLNNNPNELNNNPNELNNLQKCNDDDSKMDVDINTYKEFLEFKKFLKFRNC
jgi:DNA invertase Pin-like site-specific DNA recombinase